MKKQMIQNHIRYAVKSWVDERLKAEGLVNDGKDCLTDDQIQAYAAHQLSPEERNNVMKHISSCMPCFIKTEQYYDNYTLEIDFKRQFNVLGGIDSIQYGYRANDLHLRVSSLTSDLSVDEYKKHPAIITVSNQKFNTNFTVVPVPTDDKVNISIAITSNQVIFRHNINIPLEIIYEKEIVPLKISKKSDELYESQFDFNKLTDGTFYIYPEIVEQKVLSIYILKLQNAISKEQTTLVEKQPEISQIETDHFQKKQISETFQKIKSFLEIIILIETWKRHKRTLMFMLMFFMFSYFSYDYLTHYIQPSSTTKHVVSLPWETEKTLAADVSRRSFPRYMAFAAGLWKKRSEVFPDYSSEIPKCILPENAISEMDLDQWNQDIKLGIYYQLGMACLNIYVKKETDQALTSSFIKKQIQIFKNIQISFSKHANKNDIAFVDKRLLQIISILSNIKESPLKKQRNELFKNVYSIMHYLSPHYALK